MTSALLAPPRWSHDELEAGRLESKEHFRRERLQEPLDDYLAYFEKFHDATAEVLQQSGDLSQLHQAASTLLRNDVHLFVFRYLTGPPMSADDLMAVADIPSLTPSRLDKRPEDVARLVETILAALDPRRFPWIEQARQPHPEERTVAIRATAALIAAQRVATKRRTEGKSKQEERVRRALVACGFDEVERRTVRVLADAPEPGKFCAEAKLGTRKADFIVKLHDRRVMAIECKVSNSYLNSIKRLNNDAAAKAEVWRRDFGETQVVPTAVLSGLYKLNSLVEAQRRGLTLFWAHRLEQLGDWLKRAR